MWWGQFISALLATPPHLTLSSMGEETDLLLWGEWQFLRKYEGLELFLWPFLENTICYIGPLSQRPKGLPRHPLLRDPEEGDKPSQMECSALHLAPTLLLTARGVETVPQLRRGGNGEPGWLPGLLLEVSLLAPEGQS